MISAEKIPNNVNLSSNKRLQRALEHWQPKYIQWWRDMGPQGFQDYHLVYVRTAVSVDREGRDEAEELLERQSGNRDKPRILEAFNEPIDNWLDFFMFTMFTDRDGKSQLMSLSESSLDPLSRTTRFMLTEEAHHMFVGETGVARILERTCQLMKEAGFSGDVRKLGGIDLPTIQKHLNQWFSLSLDLHGSEVSSNAASYFANGLKGRAKEETFDDHLVTSAVYNMEFFEEGRPVGREVSMRNAMNEVLRDWYVGDCAAGVERWNRILEQYGFSDRLRLPDRKFNRGIGMYAGLHFEPNGAPLSRQEWERRKYEWLPSRADSEYLLSIMARPVYEPGKFANYIAPPRRGINQQPIDFEYVRTEH